MRSKYPRRADNLVDRFTAPIAEATVWLDFGRGGMRGGPAERNRRVPDPVRTDAEGRLILADALSYAVDL